MHYNMNESWKKNTLSIRSQTQKRLCIVWFLSYEMSGIGQSIDKETRLVLARDWEVGARRENEEWLLDTRQEVFCLGDENVLKLDRSNGCIIWWMYKCQGIVHLQVDFTLIYNKVIASLKWMLSRLMQQAERQTVEAGAIIATAEL